MIRDIVSKMTSLFDAAERRSVLVLLVLIVVNGVIETVGIVSVMPFLALVTNPDVIHTNRFLDTLYQWFGAGDLQHFLTWVGILTIIVLALSNAVSAITAWAIFRFTYHQGFRLGRRLLNGYLSQPYEFFLVNNTVDLSRNVYDEVPRVITGVVLPAMQAVAKAVSSLMILLLLVIVDTVLAATVLFTFAGAYYVLHTIVQRRLTVVREVASRSRSLTLRLASEALSGIKELKILGHEEKCLDAYTTPALAVADADAKNQLLGTLPKYLLETLAFGGIVVVVLFLLARSASPMAILPVVALYAFAGYRILPALQQIYVNMNYIHYYYPSLKLVEAHLSQSAAHVKTSAPPAEERIVSLNHAIELHGVRFRYPTASQDVLNDLTLRIPAGSVIGVVGTTGSGKSTMLDIVLGLLSPTGGELRIDGTTLTSAHTSAWQQHIGYVPQQIYLSDGTVAQNIAFGSVEGDIDLSRVEQAARAAQLHEFIARDLPDGYNTYVGERGVRLSGGQRQRVGIARALYRDPPVLVFDEATSALDNLTEASIMETLRGFVRHKTIILVAHRLTTLRLCDQIMLLADGRVVQQGTYDELLKNSVVFRDLDAAGRAQTSEVG